MKLAQRLDPDSEEAKGEETNCMLKRLPVALHRLLRHVDVALLEQMQPELGPRPIHARAAEERKPRVRRGGEARDVWTRRRAYRAHREKRTESTSAASGWLRSSPRWCSAARSSR
mgnify:CR=1 FL=1